MKKYLILDCFVDEPACFGVPPFVSPYPRYIYGALLDAGCSNTDITYFNIEQFREQELYLQEKYDYVFLVGGAVVPGKYLGHKIGTKAEIHKILANNPQQDFVVGGMTAQQLKETNYSNTLLCFKDIEKYAYNLALGKPEDEFRTVREIARWSKLGAIVVQQHHLFPNLIIEIETYRGCPRQQHCSFCSEQIHTNIEFRQVEEILTEIDALITHGISRFRLGRQADIIAYGSELSTFKQGFPQPNPTEVQKLFGELKKRKDDKKIKVLNIDNGNPGTIANFPEESAAALEAIVAALTPGDTLAMGVESFDPAVKVANNLKIDKEEALFVIKLVNEIGGQRIGGIPVLLPGINLIHGLRAETDKTFKMNYLALQEIKDAGLLVKRINIRKLLPFPGTPLENFKISKNLTNRYEFYKEKIRKEIDGYMLKQIYPVGTLLKDVLIEDEINGYSYGKQISSYSITCKTPEILEQKSLQDLVVISQRERSLITLPHPIDFNNINQKELELIPGIGRKQSGNIILNRPFTDLTDLQNKIPSCPPEILKHIKF